MSANAEAMAWLRLLWPLTPGVNIELAYLATNTRLVLAAADVDKLKAAV